MLGEGVVCGPWGALLGSDEDAGAAVFPAAGNARPSGVGNGLCNCSYLEGSRRVGRSPEMSKMTASVDKFKVFPTDRSVASGSLWLRRGTRTFTGREGADVVLLPPAELTACLERDTRVQNRVPTDLRAHEDTWRAAGARPAFADLRVTRVTAFTFCLGPPLPPGSCSFFRPELRGPPPWSTVSGGCFSAGLLNAGLTVRC